MVKPRNVCWVLRRMANDEAQKYSCELTRRRRKVNARDLADNSEEEEERLNPRDIAGERRRRR